MPYLKRDNKDREPVEIYYEDKGTGKPIVFIHGWPLSGVMWEYQINDLLRDGYRCITYDRRGFGKSSRPGNGYDYDTMTDDLNALMEKLNLQDVFLVGFSMGGGEVARYFTRHGGKRVTRAALVSAVTPSILKTESNPNGVPEKALNEIMKNIKEDRQAFLKQFSKDFFGVGFLNQPVSDELMHYYQMVACEASPIATQDTAEAWGMSNFEQDCRNISVPTLIIHGKDDQTVPIETAGDRAAKLIPDNTYRKYDDAPHGLFITHKKQLNADLKDWAARSVKTSNGLHAEAVA